MHELPEYPIFRKIDPKDESWYNTFYSDFEPHADFCFSNLNCWLDINDDLCLSRLEGNLVYRFTDVLGSAGLNISYSIFGKSAPDIALNILAADKPKRLTMVPDFFIRELKNKQHAIQSDRDNWDYVYDANEFSSLSGPAYKRIRYQIKSFTQAHEDHCEISIHNLSKKLGEDLLRELNSWERAYQFGNDPEEIENIALFRRLISHAHHATKIVLLKINKRTEAFTVYSEPPQKEYAIIHHIKCSYRYDHLFDYLFYKTVAKLESDGKRFVNLEQDLGIPGLRHHKQLLRPTLLLKKYNINLGA